MSTKVQEDDMNSIIKERIDNFEISVDPDEKGEVIEYNNGIAIVINLNNCMPGEIICFDKKVRGVVTDLNEESIEVILLGSKVKKGDICSRLGELLEVPIGQCIKNKSHMLGEILQIIGPIVDIKFDNYLPQINEIIEVNTFNRKVILEVAAIMDGNKVRTIALDETIGLTRKEEVKATGKNINSAENTLEKIFFNSADKVESDINEDIVSAFNIDNIEIDNYYSKYILDIDYLKNKRDISEILYPNYIFNFSFMGGVGIGKTVGIIELLNKYEDKKKTVLKYLERNKKGKRSIYKKLE